jgi:hypothetical protein
MSVESRDQELGRSVVARKKELLKVLTPEEQKTTQRHGSTTPETFEEKAQHLVDDQGPRARFIESKLKAFQEAVNALWVHAIETGVPEKIVSGWKRKHRGYSWLSKDDLQAEAMFRIRHFIVRYDPDEGGGAGLFSYAYRGLQQQLTEWAAQQGPVQLPTDEARRHTPNVGRQSLDSRPEGRDCGEQYVEARLGKREALKEQTTYDPWDAVDAFLDGDIRPEDL